MHSDRKQISSCLGMGAREQCREGQERKVEKENKKTFWGDG